MPQYKSFFFLVSSIFSLVLWQCSTEKNTLLSRTYHGTTAKYNGHFNAEELLYNARKSFSENYKENYYDLLPIEIFPNEEEIKGMYPAVDTAIVKCSRVIGNHAMPTASKPWAKDDEHNRWIDENWITIGGALYLRRDYEGAMKSFKYIQDFWTNDPSNFTAEVWMARTNLALGKKTEALFNLTNIEKYLKEQDNQAKSKKNASKSSKIKRKTSKTKKKTRKSNKHEEPPAPTKALRLLFAKTKAEYHLLMKEDKLAIESLEEGLKNVRKKREKARLHFVLAQLNARNGDNTKAQFHYAKVLKYPAPYEMHFQARINRAFAGGDEKVKKDLLKMLRDEKNKEFRDQIYFALADIDLKANDQPKAIIDLNNSVLYSVNNNRQKGVSYEKLGDIAMTRRDYVPAQRYYDSSANVLPKDFPRYELIVNKAAKLKDLVKQVEIVEFEDSVQRIALLSDEDQVKFIEKFAKEKKEKDRIRIEQEKAKLKELQKLKADVEDNKGGAKWYWSNPKSRTEGLDQFKKTWGSRENTDDWRRSKRTNITSSASKEIDTTSDQANIKEEIKDPLSTEILLANIPNSDSSLLASQKRLIEALYTGGSIYYDQLNEDKKAYEYLERATKMTFEDRHKLLASYKIYTMYKEADETKAFIQKEFILTYYPLSDYAGYLRDPNYFIKKKQLDALAEEEYVSMLERYNRKLYGIVLEKANQVIETDSANIFRSKFMLLKAMSMGQTTEDKLTLLPILDQCVAQYPNTDESKRAKEMIAIIKNGYSKNLPNDFNKKSEYLKLESDEVFFILIFLNASENGNSARIKISDFNKEFYGREALQTSSKAYAKQSVIMVKTLTNVATCLDYMLTYKKTKAGLEDLRNRKILFASQANMKILFEKMDLENYESWFDDNY